nr:MAG TPA: hypothetical protein [Caudoviricetes sp.]
MLIKSNCLRFLFYSHKVVNLMQFSYELLMLSHKSRLYLQ